MPKKKKKKGPFWMVFVFVFGRAKLTSIKGRSGPPLRMLLLIFIISGEQLSFNVAGDSAKTLSVLGNMGCVLGDCGLRFVQNCRRPPQNTPDFGGPISKKKNHGHAALPNR